MDHNVTSRFSVFSPVSMDSEQVSSCFPWAVADTSLPDDPIDGIITVFDIGAGGDSRVDQHLLAVKESLLCYEKQLSELSRTCQFALWVSYTFPNGDGVINLPVDIQAAFASLNTEIVFRLNEDFNH